jgi:hypothetical protein
LSSGISVGPDLRRDDGRKGCALYQAAMTLTGGCRPNEVTYFSSWPRRRPSTQRSAYLVPVVGVGATATSTRCTIFSDTCVDGRLRGHDEKMEIDLTSFGRFPGGGQHRRGLVLLCIVSVQLISCVNPVARKPYGNFPAGLYPRPFSLWDYHGVPPREGVAAGALRPREGGTGETAGDRTQPVPRGVFMAAGAQKAPVGYAARATSHAHKCAPVPSSRSSRPDGGTLKQGRPVP